VFDIADMLELCQANDSPAMATDRINWSADAWGGLGKETRYAAGEHIFRKNALAGELFYILSGTVLLEEFSVRVGANDVLGEVAFFLPEKRRTASALCLTDVTVRCIDQAWFREIFEREPMLRMRVLHAFGEHMLADLIRVYDASSLAHDTRDSSP
jgi:CRP-like cAMP-binding protein